MDQPNVVFFKYLMRDIHGNVLLDFSRKAHGEFENSQFIPLPLRDLLANLKVGDKGTANVPKEKGYGEYNEELLFEVHQNRLDKSVRLGQRIVVDFKDGQSLEAVAIQIKDPYIIFDGNHPFAGKDVFFEVELLRRRPATKSEVDSGIVEMEC